MWFGLICLNLFWRLVNITIRLVSISYSVRTKSRYTIQKMLDVKVYLRNTHLYQNKLPFLLIRTRLLFYKLFIVYIAYRFQDNMYTILKILKGYGFFFLFQLSFLLFRTELLTLITEQQAKNSNIHPFLICDIYT